MGGAPRAQQPGPRYFLRLVPFMASTGRKAPNLQDKRDPRRTHPPRKGFTQLCFRGSLLLPGLPSSWSWASRKGGHPPHPSDGAVRQALSPEAEGPGHLS